MVKPVGARPRQEVQKCEPKIMDIDYKKLMVPYALCKLHKSEHGNEDWPCSVNTS